MRISKTQWPSPEDNGKLRRSYGLSWGTVAATEGTEQSWRPQENDNGGASNKVGPQTLHINCDKVDQITA